MWRWREESEKRDSVTLNVCESKSGFVRLLTEQLYAVLVRNCMGSATAILRSRIQQAFDAWWLRSTSTHTRNRCWRYNFMAWLKKKKKGLNWYQKNILILISQNDIRSICESLRMSQPFTLLYLCWLSSAACCHINICSTAKWLLLERHGGKEGKQEREKWICKSTWKNGFRGEGGGEGSKVTIISFERKPLPVFTC